MKNNNNNNKTIIFTDRKYHVRRLKSVGIYPIYPPKRRMTIYRIVTIYNKTYYTRWNAWRLLKSLVRLIRVRTGDTYNCTIVPVVPAWFRELTCYNGYTGSVLLYVLYTVYCYTFYGQWCTLCSGQWLDDFSHIKRFTHYNRREYICIRYGVYYMYTDLQVVGWFEFII